MQRIQDARKAALLALAAPIFLAIGALVNSQIIERSNGASAIKRLEEAQTAFNAGDKGRALFLLGASTSLSSSATLFAAASEIAVDCGQQTLARQLVAQALEIARPEEQEVIRHAQEHLGLPLY